MTVGFYSPLPPARTGVADYSAALLAALSAGGSVEVNARNADIALYHIGNNQLHSAIYRRALEVPGVVVLHDAVLHHFLLGWLSEREYIREFVYNYGDWAEDQARALWRGRARSAADPVYFRYPMLKRVAECSLAVIVHNPGAAAMLRSHAPDAAIYEIPHLFAGPAAPPAAWDVIRLRQRLEIPGHVFLFSVFGHLRESKRLASVLRAFERVRPHAAMALVVAGDFVSKDLERSLGPLVAANPHIRRVGFTEEPDFWRYAAASDACINLRYPAAGETSGISIRMMGIAKPVLMNGGLETSRFPEAACVRVDAGPGEEEMLAEYMLWLAGRTGDARAIGQRAAEYVCREHAPRRAAELYWDALTACYHKA